jgi:hypothetical protein
MILEIYVSFISNFSPEPYHNCCEEWNCQLSAIEMTQEIKRWVRRFSDITGNITQYIFVTFHFSFQSNLIRTSVPRVIMEHK